MAEGRDMIDLPALGLDAVSEGALRAAGVVWADELAEMPSGQVLAILGDDQAALRRLQRRLADMGFPPPSPAALTVTHEQGALVVTQRVDVAARVPLDVLFRWMIRAEPLYWERALAHVSTHDLGDLSGVARDLATMCMAALRTRREQAARASETDAPDAQAFLPATRLISVARHRESGKVYIMWHGRHAADSVQALKGPVGLSLLGDEAGGLREDWPVVAAALTGRTADLDARAWAGRQWRQNLWHVWSTRLDTAGQDAGAEGSAPGAEGAGDAP